MAERRRLNLAEGGVDSETSTSFRLILL